MENRNWNKILDKIDENHEILITTHIHPDGDGLGSEKAMYNVLKKILYILSDLLIRKQPGLGNGK